jgi:hypothetical protein
MAVQTQNRQVGDTRISIATTLTRLNGTVVDVSSPLIVKFTMVETDGTVKVAETETGVTKDDAVNGEVSYAPLAADVDTVGTFYAYFIVEDGDGKQDTFPVKEGDLIIEIQPQGAESTTEDYPTNLATTRLKISKLLIEITSNPKPSYVVNGQDVKWTEYQKMLMEQLKALNDLIEAGEVDPTPFEIRSVGIT